MDNSTVTWIVIALVLLAVLVVVGAVLSRRRQAQQVEVQRKQARELREKAEVDRIEVQRREAEASRIDAQARLAQAEADARAADAAELQAKAREQAAHASGARSELDEQLRKADELDPQGRSGVHGEPVVTREPIGDGPLDGDQQVHRETIHDDGHQHPHPEGGSHAADVPGQRDR